MNITTKTAQRLNDLDYVIKESKINSMIRKIAQSNKDEIINFKNELKEIIGEYEWKEHSKLIEIHKLIQEIESVEKS